MNPDLEHMIVLQAQDLELQRLRSERMEAPRRVQTAEAARATAEKRVVTLRGSLASEEKLRRDQESEIAAHRTKIERLRRSLDAATSEAQIAAFGNETRFAEAAVAHLEEEELASMERTEQLEVELTEAAAVSADAQGLLESERTRAARITEGNRVAIAGLEEQRSQLRARIGEQWLSIYDRLGKAKGSAIAEALGNATQGKCAACQMSVRPQRWQDLIGREHEEEIFACESCGRLLFWDPRRDTPRAWEAGDRLRGAQAGMPAAAPGNRLGGRG